MKTLITGNTYPVRAEMRALGGRWNKSAQGRDMPTEKADEARAIVAGAGPKRSRRSRYGSIANDNSSYEDRECGDRAYEDRCARACGFDNYY